MPFFTKYNGFYFTTWIIWVVKTNEKHKDPTLFQPIRVQRVGQVIATHATDIQPAGVYNLFPIQRDKYYDIVRAIVRAAIVMRNPIIAHEYIYEQLHQWTSTTKVGLNGALNGDQ